MMNSAIYCTGDTIAAETTPSGRGGLSVIRISGTEAGRIVGNLFDRELPEKDKHRYGRLLRKSKESEEMIDEVVVSCFKAPNSYTGEDVYEISTHGSPVIVSDALNAIYEQGARPAGPGEFTLRAYLNGRIDLTQAEAIADLVNASSREAADQALKQLRGGIGQAAERISRNIFQLLTQCELELDFVEDDIELIPTDRKIEMLSETLDEIDSMLEGYSRSRRLREGVKVAITGPPNVGKSSLFNALVGKPKAIVHRLPGTTRDVLQADCIIKGVKFQLFDTAGIRETLSEIEDEGVRRAMETADNAELRMEVTSVDMKDLEIEDVQGNEDVIKVLNKTDIKGLEVSSDIITISALRGDGISDLKDKLYGAIVTIDKAESHTISRERHYHAVMMARNAIDQAKRGIESGYPSEMIAEELRDAVTAMDKLTGRSSLDALLENVFSEFCIGK